METKKSTKASIEKMRFPITLTALLFTGSIVLASFSYTTQTERESSQAISQNSVDIQFIETPADVDPPEQQPQQDVMLPPDDNIIIDSNTQVDPPKVTITLLPPPDIKVTKTTIIESPIIDFPDVEATFDAIGDISATVAMQRWIGENVQYPQTSIEMNEQGRVYLSFVVEVDGSISNISIERGVSADLDREAKRLLRQMPKWIPGEAKGHKVRTRCRLPINFTLN